MRPNPYRRPATPQARRAEMMRSAAMRKRAFGYTTIRDGEDRFEYSMLYLRSAAVDLKKAIDAAQRAIEEMGAMQFQGERATLSNDERDYVYGLDDWGRTQNARLDWEMRHLAEILDKIQDAIDEGETRR